MEKTDEFRSREADRNESAGGSGQSYRRRGGPAVDDALDRRKCRSANVQAPNTTPSPVLLSDEAVLWDGEEKVGRKRR